MICAHYQNLSNKCETPEAHLGDLVKSTLESICFSPFKRPHAPPPPSSNHHHRRSMYQQQQQQQQSNSASSSPSKQQQPQNSEYLARQNADLQKLREQNEAIARQRSEFGMV